MPITEWKCTSCEEVTEDICIGWKNIPKEVTCQCGSKCSRIVSTSTFDATKKTRYEFLGPQPMELNYSEKKAYLKKNNLQEAGDSVGGSKDNWASNHLKKQRETIKKEQAKHRREFLKKELKIS